MKKLQKELQMNYNVVKHYGGRCEYCKGADADVIFWASSLGHRYRCLGCGKSWWVRAKRLTPPGEYPVKIISYDDWSDKIVMEVEFTEGKYKGTRIRHILMNK